MKWMAKVAIGMLVFAALMIALSVAVMKSNENSTPSKVKSTSVELEKINKKAVDGKPI